jgi:hypothetical protein
VIKKTFVHNAGDDAKGMVSVFSRQHSDLQIKEKTPILLICYTRMINVIEFTAYKHLTKIVRLDSTRGGFNAQLSNYSLNAFLSGNQTKIHS